MMRIGGLRCGSFLVLIAAVTLSCAKKDSSGTSADIQETAQQVGDVMASIDESGGSSSGGFATMDTQSTERMFARVAPASKIQWVLESFEDLRKSLLPRAEAVSCGLASTFGSCTSNIVDRTFGGCTIGTTTLAGTVRLTWTDANNSDNTCAMATAGHTITRNPNFTITGRRGGSLEVTKAGTNGQVLTRGATAADYTFANDGIRRKITYQGSVLFDFTTTTTAPLTITGLLRNGRTLTSSGGAGLKVTNNVSGVSCTYVPTAVTWSNSCTCAVSGSWASTCSDGKASSLSVTGCGTADFTMGSEVESLYFDRCYSI